LRMGAEPFNEDNLPAIINSYYSSRSSV
jgi:hypothetical protein